MALIEKVFLEKSFQIWLSRLYHDDVSSMASLISWFDVITNNLLLITYWVDATVEIATVATGQRDGSESGIEAEE